MENNISIIKIDKNLRKYYLDILKIISCIAVIVLHTCSRDMKLVSPISNRYQVLNFFDSLTRFAVPIFVMVSGALFLNKNKKVDVKRLYTKNVLRLFSAYLFWSIVYGLFSYYCLKNYTSLISAMQSVMLMSYFHLWFIPMMISIYLLIPFLKKIVDNSNKNEIFTIIMLFFIFKIVNDTICRFDYPELEYIQAILKRFLISRVVGFVGYFFLGYYLSTYKIDKKNRIIIYILGILGLAMCTLINSICSIKNGKFAEYLLNDFTITTFFEAIAIFTFIKYGIEKIDISYKAGKIIERITANSFGIYLVHMLFMDYIRERIGFSTLSINAIFAIPIMTVSVFLLSYITVALIRKIPVVNKYIV
ncbi:MAG: acyltransferase family protein [Clostridia bacterium]|nr:acyltransferase family protein [Clostridia bacterium]